MNIQKLHRKLNENEYLLFREIGHWESSKIFTQIRKCLLKIITSMEISLVWVDRNFNMESNDISLSGELKTKQQLDNYNF